MKLIFLIVLIQKLTFILFAYNFEEAITKKKQWSIWETEMNEEMNYEFEAANTKLADIDLLSFEKLDRSSPDLWPQLVPGLSEFANLIKSVSI